MRARSYLTPLLIAYLLGCSNAMEQAASHRDPEGGQFISEQYSGETGARNYKLYVPGGYDGSEAWPLMVELHGCSSDADEEARWSRFNTLAETYQILVAYPEQSAQANGNRCWNWFLPTEHSRDEGEPAIIAGITRQIQNNYKVDVSRTYIGGISAGGGMANILAVTYPDVYAAVMIYAGCEYKGTTCTGSLAILPPEISGELAYTAMGEHARAVPVLVLQGDQDLLVPYPNAEFIVQQYLASADWTDDGDNNGSIPRAPENTDQGRVEGGYEYEIDHYRHPGGCLIAQRWLVHGLGHAWSQGESNGSLRDALLTDPLGPDLSRASLDFLLSHQLSPQSTACSSVEKEADHGQ